MRLPPVGITMGDPAGIGPEIIVKALAGQTPSRRWRIIGSRSIFEQTARKLGMRFNSDLVDDVVTAPGRYSPGRVQKSCGRAAFSALETGARLLRDKEISALVTAPVAKTALRLAGFCWPGQTEFLAARLSCPRYAMLAWTPEFKAVFVTIHEPLARVSRRITADAVLEKIRLLHEFLRQEEPGRTAPRIAVMALNPHAREFSLGEENRIAAAVQAARRAGLAVSGPIPADAAVAALRLDESRRFDGFVAMYHDQAMIPAKLLGRTAGVNVTLGLGRIRTSPLHGTAFDIAGRGIADPGSMRAALHLALHLASTARSPSRH